MYVCILVLYYDDAMLLLLATTSGVAEFWEFIQKRRSDSQLQFYSFMQLSNVQTDLSEYYPPAAVVAVIHNHYGRTDTLYWCRVDCMEIPDAWM